MRTTVELTKGFVRRAKLPPGSNQPDVFYFDALLPGFYLRVYANGSKKFGVRTSVRGKPLRASIGPASPSTLDAARERAREILLAARAGKNLPAAEKAKAKRDANRKTMAAAIAEYLEARKPEFRARTFPEVKRYLENHWHPLHKLYVDEVSRGDVLATLDDIAAKSGKVAADRARTALSAFFGWCIDPKNYCDYNPARDIKARSTNGSRDRVLTAAELRDVWRAAGNDAYGRAAKLLILTGCRKTEIGDLQWPEINAETRQIELPGSRTKNKRPHIVPLAPLAWSIIASVERRPDWEARPYVFGRYGYAGLGGWTKGKAELDQRSTKARRGKPLQRWTVHDIRRTVATLMNELGIAEPHVVEACLNHISGSKAGVAGTYNRAAYAEQKRRALERWADWIAELVS
jgi:integrase